MDSKPVKKSFARTPVKPMPDSGALESFVNKAATAAPFVQSDMDRDDQNDDSKRAIKKTFSITNHDMLLIKEARARVAKISAHDLMLNNSEVVRLGIIAILRMDEADLLDAAGKLERLDRSR